MLPISQQIALGVLLNGRGNEERRVTRSSKNIQLVAQGGPLVFFDRITGFNSVSAQMKAFVDHIVETDSTKVTYRLEQATNGSSTFTMRPFRNRIEERYLPMVFEISGTLDDGRPTARKGPVKEFEVLGNHTYHLIAIDSNWENGPDPTEFEVVIDLSDIDKFSIFAKDTKNISRFRLAFGKVPSETTVNVSEFRSDIEAIWTAHDDVLRDLDLDKEDAHTYRVQGTNKVEVIMAGSKHVLDAPWVRIKTLGHANPDSAIESIEMITPRLGTFVVNDSGVTLNGEDAKVDSLRLTVDQIDKATPQSFNFFPESAALPALLAVAAVALSASGWAGHSLSPVLVARVAGVAAMALGAYQALFGSVSTQVPSWGFVMLAIASAVSQVGALQGLHDSSTMIIARIIMLVQSQSMSANLAIFMSGLALIYAGGAASVGSTAPASQRVSMAMAAVAALVVVGTAAYALSEGTKVQSCLDASMDLSLKKALLAENPGFYEKEVDVLVRKLAQCPSPDTGAAAQTSGRVVIGGVIAMIMAYAAWKGSSRQAPNAAEDEREKKILAVCAVFAALMLTPTTPECDKMAGAKEAFMEDAHGYSGEIASKWNEIETEMMSRGCAPDNSFAILAFAAMTFVAAFLALPGKITHPVLDALLALYIGITAADRNNREYLSKTSIYDRAAAAYYGASSK